MNPILKAKGIIRRRMQLGKSELDKQFKIRVFSRQELKWWSMRLNLMKTIKVRSKLFDFTEMAS